MMFGLDEKTIKRLVAVLKESKAVKRAVIFGSRARGDHKYNSDIDIALYADGQPKADLFLDIDDAAGIYKTNIIIMDHTLDEKLRRNIERDGVEIFMQN